MAHTFAYCSHTATGLLCRSSCLLPVCWVSTSMRRPAGTKLLAVIATVASPSPFSLAERCSPPAGRPISNMQTLRQCRTPASPSAQMKSQVGTLIRWAAVQPPHTTCSLANATQLCRHVHHHHRSPPNTPNTHPCRPCGPVTVSASATAPAAQRPQAPAPPPPTPPATALPSPPAA